MNSAYAVGQHLRGALAIGDDEAGKALVVMEGASGRGLYGVPFGALAVEEAVYLSRSLGDLLLHGEGIAQLLDDS